ncbi:MAG: 16S rRNA (guanine(527)-N(7))-methyltransferase RsmG [Spirochaetia bacterium]|jgi:16S rRNA (guanine527-N7)-methyltransferase
MSAPAPRDLLREGLIELAVPEPERVQGLLELFIAELERWNPRFGLVKYADREELVVKHLLDSLSAWREVQDAALAWSAVRDAAAGGAVLDVGSGAGFPGIPLAAALPDLSFTLLERMSRRATFLKTCAILLGLRRVTVEQRDLSQLSGSFDVVTFRALAPLPRIVEDLGASGVTWGTMMAYKGREARAREEIESVRRSAGGKLSASLVTLHTPFLDEERCLAVVDKRVRAG